MRQVKERPIIFSGPMVRAILDGRKTQTRRVIKPQPEFIASSGCWRWPLPKSIAATVPMQAAVTASREWHEYLPPGCCPYGVPGDRLWVRETWAYRHNEDGVPVTPREYFYAATDAWEGRRMPSIHMPRDASRITLEITTVRAQRVQEITNADANAEGMFPHIRGGWHWVKHNPSDQNDWDQFGYTTPLVAFEEMWREINGEDSWLDNPWAWAISFKTIDRTD